MSQAIHNSLQSFKFSRNIDGLATTYSIPSIYITNPIIANPLVEKLISGHNKTTVIQYYHGTGNHEDALSIVKNGILVSNSKSVNKTKVCNFSNWMYPAFYVSNNYEYAKIYASSGGSRKKYGVIVFEMRKSWIATGNFTVLSLLDDEPLWHNVLNFFQPKPTLTKGERTSLETKYGVCSKDAIEGNLSTSLVGPKFKQDPVLQMAIKSQDMATALSQPANMKLLFFDKK